MTDHTDRHIAVQEIKDAMDFTNVKSCVECTFSHDPYGMGERCQKNVLEFGVSRFNVCKFFSETDPSINEE